MLKIVKSRTENLTNSEFYLFLCILSLLLMSIGGTLNFIVITNNGGKMPVLGYSSFETESHRFYKNITESNYWYLGDIIGKQDRIMISIGDILMYFSVVFFSVCSYKFYKSKIIKKKKLK